MFSFSQPGVWLQFAECLNSAGRLEDAEEAFKQVFISYIIIDLEIKFFTHQINYSSNSLNILLNYVFCRKKQGFTDN